MLGSRLRAGVFALMIGFVLVTALGGCSDPDRHLLARLEPAEQERFKLGRRVALPCWTCHDLAGTVKKVGPSLLGMYGRQSGRAGAR